MLELTPNYFARLARESEDYQLDLLESYEDSIERYAYGLRGRITEIDGETEADPENRSFEWVSQMSSSLCAGDPQVKMGTTRTEDEFRQEAEAHQYAINRYSRQRGLRKLNEALIPDFGMFSPMVMVEPGSGDSEENTGHAKDTWPRCTRISPTRRLIDTQALTLEETRFIGDRVVADRADLIDRAKKYPDEAWNLDTILAMAEETVDEKQEMRRSNRRQVDRRQVSYWRVWVPEVDPESDEAKEAGIKIPEDCNLEQCHGIIVYFGYKESDGGDDVKGWVRQPHPYWGHSDGPYEWGGAYVVPDEPVKLSPVGATRHQVNELNVHWRAALDSMRDYARMTFYDASSPDLGKKIQEGGHHHTIPVNSADLKNAAMSLEKGGITAQHQAMIGMLSELVDRSMGMHDAQRGAATGQATATENIFAQQAWGSRTAFLVRKFMDMNEGIFKRLSWYLYHQDDVQIALAEMPGAVYSGGLEGLAWEELDLTIDPWSMMRTSQQAEQAQGQFLLQTVPPVAQAMLSSPHVDWEKFWGDVGDRVGMPQLPEMFDYKLTAQIGALMLQQQGGEPSQGSEARPQARLSRDAGTGNAGGNFRPRPQMGSVQGAGAPQMGGQTSPSSGMTPAGNTG